VAQKPDKFKKPTEYKVFFEAMQAYLDLLDTEAGPNLPLRYVIREVAIAPLNAVYETDREQGIAIAPLVGPAFQRDNARVYGILKQLCLEGPGRSYILPFDATSNGRAAWEALKAHFESDSFRNKAKNEAYATLHVIHYDGERKGFNFEKYVEKHNECFLELERQSEPVPERKKVQDFLDRITAPELQAAKQQVMVNAELMTDFQRASNFVALSVPSAKPDTRRIGQVKVENNPPKRGGRGGGTYGRGLGRSGSMGGHSVRSSSGRGRGRWQGQARGGRGRGRGPDTRYYTPEEWQNLSREQQTQVLEARGTKRQVNQVTTDTQHLDMSVITDTHASNQGSMARRRTGGSAGDQFGPAGHSTVGMLRSLARRAVTTSPSSDVIARVDSRRRSAQPPSLLYVDLDSHADTACIGSNCRVLAYSSFEVDVQPYHPQYKSITGVPVVQAATAYDDPETGTTYILVINQGLYFGDTLENTLLNPNQMRMNGVIVDDVPKHLAPDPVNATHSIFIPQHELRIALEMRGVISCWPGRKPTDDEIETCTWIHLTPEAEWDPHSEDFAHNERLASEQAYCRFHG
jgi:hypothetical protein